MQQERFDRPYGGRRVCVAGGAGFIGLHLVGSLLDLGATVCVIDDLSASELDGVAALVDRAPERVPFVHGSVLDPLALQEAVEGAEVVFHLAAIASVAASLEDPERSFDVNATGTVRVAEAARLAGARRLVYAASSSAYGDGPSPNREDVAARPLSPYAAGKLAGEHVVSAWSHAGGVSGVSLRLFNVFGPGQPAGGAYAAVIPAFIKRLCAGEPPVIFGDGSQSRDFVFVEDVVRAFLLAGASNRDFRGEVVNVGSGRETTVLELAQTLARIVDRRDLTPQHQSARPGDVPRSVADVSRARELLRFDPTVTLEDGLTALLEEHCAP